jgi:hypothetical protein
VTPLNADAERFVRGTSGIRLGAIVLYGLAAVGIWFAPTERWIFVRSAWTPPHWELPDDGTTLAILILAMGAIATSVVAAIGAVGSVIFGWRSGTISRLVPALGAVTGFASLVLTAIAWWTFRDAAVPGASGATWSLATFGGLTAVHAWLFAAAGRIGAARADELATAEKDESPFG